MTTGGVCLNDEEKGQTGLSETVSGLGTPKASRTPSLGFRVPQQNAIIYQ